MLALLGHLQSWRGLFLLLHFGASAVIFFCCCCSVTKFCLTLQPHELQHTRLPCPSLSPSLLKLIKPPSFSYAIQPSHPLSPLFLLPSIFLSIRVFSSEYTGLISFRIDWFDLLAIQGTLKSLLQHHSWRVYFDRGSRNMASLSRDNWPLWGCHTQGLCISKMQPKSPEV